VAAVSLKSYTKAMGAEYMCPLCGETDVRQPDEPAPACEECGVEMEFFDGPDERTKRAAAMLDGGWKEEF
jgi:uncharacterized protein (DUF983 family)